MSAPLMRSAISENGFVEVRKFWRGGLREFIGGNFWFSGGGVERIYWWKFLVFWRNPSLRNVNVKIPGGVMGNFC